MKSKFAAMPRIGAGVSALIVLSMACGDGDTAGPGSGGDAIATRVEVTPETATLIFGESETLTARVYDQDGQVMHDAAVTWRSSASSVVSVTDGGLLQAVGVGAALVTASAGDASGTAELSVEPATHALATAAEARPQELVLAGLPAGAPAIVSSPVEGTLNGSALQFALVAEDTLAFSVPSLPEGTYDVEVELTPNEVGTFSITVLAPVPIDDADAVADSLIVAVTTSIDSLAADTAGDVASAMNAFRTLFDAASPDQQIETARFIATNPELFELLDFSDLQTAYDLGFAVPQDDIEARIQRLEAAFARVGMTTERVRRNGSLCLDVRETGSSQCIALPGSAGANISNVQRLIDAVRDLARERIVIDDKVNPKALRSAAIGTRGAPPRAAPAESELVFRNDVIYAIEMDVAFRTPVEADAVDGPLAALDAVLDGLDALYRGFAAFLDEAAAFLGVDLGLSGSAPGYVDPAEIEVVTVAAEDLTLGAVSNTAVSCEGALDGTTFLVSCATDASEAQTFTLPLTYVTSLEEVTYLVEATLQPSSVVIEVVAGSGQSAYPGDPLHEQIVVRVYDSADGTPVDSATVTWTASDGGSVSPATSLTDAEGHASATWTLAASEGEQQLTATAVLPSGSAVPGNAVATAVSDRGTMLQEMSGGGQTGGPGETLPDSLVVRVVDSQAVLVEGATVEWSVQGGGSVSATSIVTGTDGLASVTWTLGTDTTVAQTVTASLLKDGAHVDGSPVVFRTVAAFSYTMTDLGAVWGQASAINNHGHVVGWANQGGAFLWQDGVLRNLGAPPGKTNSYATGINDAGQVAASASGAYIWQDGVWIGPADSLGGAGAINGQGHVVSQRWVWANGQTTAFASLSQLANATDINDAGQIVGSFINPDDHRRGFVSSGGGLTELQPLPGDTASSARAINDLGQIVGYSGGATGWSAVLWQNGTVVDLGAPRTPGTMATGINDHGHIVGIIDSGAQAFFWRDGEVQSLGAGFPRAINDHGQIAGERGSAPVMWTIEGYSP